MDSNLEQFNYFKVEAIYLEHGDCVTPPKSKRTIISVLNSYHVFCKLFTLVLDNFVLDYKLKLSFYNFPFECNYRIL